MIRLLFFGKLGDLALEELGSASLELPILNDKENLTINEVINLISQKSLSLTEELKNPVNLIAINQNICTDKLKNTTNIVSGDELAFMSPLSGG